MSWCWHKCTDWAVVEHGDVRTFICQDRIGTYTIQERHCLKCGKTGIAKSQTCSQNGKLVPRTTARVPKKDGVA